VSRTPEIAAEPEPRLTLHNLHVLRTLAAYRVIVYHAACVAHWQVGATGLLDAIHLSPIRLDSFFVMSGALMVINLSRRPLSATAFLQQRLLRVLPLYWIMNGFALSLLCVHSKIFPWMFTVTRADLSITGVVSTLLLLPHDAAPLIYPAWTLSFELVLYLNVAFALALAVTGALRKTFGSWTGVALTVVSIAGCVCLGLAFGSSASILRMSKHDYVADAGFGVLLGGLFVHAEACCWRSRLRRNATLAYVMAAGALISSSAAGLLVPVPDETSVPLGNALVFGVPSALLVLSALLLESAGDWLGFNAISGVGDVQLGYGLAPWLDVRLGVAGGAFPGADSAGGLMSPLLGVAVGVPGMSVRPWLQVDAGMGFTGTLLRPLLRGALGVDLRLSNAFTLGPVFGYSHVFQTDGPRDSTDVGFLWLGIGIGFDPQKPRRVTHRFRPSKPACLRANPMASNATTAPR